MDERIRTWGGSIYGCGKSYFWCATKVNEDEEIAEGGQNWGECDDNCRRHGTLKVFI